jgi:enoyl-CoA hydratase
MLRLGREARSLEECLEREFSATRRTLKEKDFYEGIRAAVIDKDRNPRWEPPSLGEVSSADVDRFFDAGPLPLFGRQSCKWSTT